MRIEHIGAVCIEFVPLEICGQIRCPPRGESEQIGSRNINLLLPIVIIHRLYGTFGRHDVIHIVVGVFGLDFIAVEIRHLLP